MVGKTSVGKTGYTHDDYDDDDEDDDDDNPPLPPHWQFFFPVHVFLERGLNSLLMTIIKLMIQMMTIITFQHNYHDTDMAVIQMKAEMRK